MEIWRMIDPARNEGQHPRRINAALSAIHTISGITFVARREFKALQERERERLESDALIHAACE